MNYKKKEPIIIEALQWPGYPTSEIQTFAGEFLKPTEPREGIGVVGYYLNTPNGYLWLHTKDYIVKDINGQFFHYTPFNFEKTYEKID